MRRQQGRIPYINEQIMELQTNEMSNSNKVV